MAEGIPITPEEKKELVGLLKQAHLFQGISEDDLVDMASQFATMSLKGQTRLFSEGDEADSFFIILRGSIRILKRTGRIMEDVAEEALISTLVSGDYFGEGALMFNRPRGASAVAASPTTLVWLGGDAFISLLAHYPQVEQKLITIEKGYELAQQKHFNWLGEDEALHLVARKHISVFWFSLFRLPLLFAIFTAITAFFTFSAPSLLVKLSPLLPGVITLGLIIWNWVDWGDDYYIITDKRIIWLEEIPFLYDSREEAPLSTLLSVNVETSFLQRALGYGDVVVRTYTGSIMMKNVGNPEEFKTQIEEYWFRERERSGRAETAALEDMVLGRIGLPTHEESKPKAEAPAKPAQPDAPEEKPGVLARFYSSAFKMRFEKDGVITYRKHWFLLLEQIGVPTIWIGIGIVLVSIGINLYISGTFLIAMLGWWLFGYVDWRNDRYELTFRDIFDLEKRPLGREVTKSAPLENILSLEHRRDSILERIFDFGTVIVNVGDTTFNFIGVHNPTWVQQEIATRQQARKKKLQAEETAREQGNILDLIAAYHNATEDIWERNSPSAFGDDDDVEDY